MVNTALWTRNLFLGSAIIAAFTSFSRADYNLPLFVFAYMAWGLQKVTASHFHRLIFTQTVLYRIKKSSLDGSSVSHFSQILTGFSSGVHSGIARLLFKDIGRMAFIRWSSPSAASILH